MAKPATRIGDKDVKHDCETPYRAEGSDDVFVNGRAWSRIGDFNTKHIFGPKCKQSHRAAIAEASESVFINGRGAGRIGDKVGGCTHVAEGSDDVFAGD